MKYLYVTILLLLCIKANSQSLPSCIDSGLTTRYLNQGFQIIIRHQNAIPQGKILATGFRSDTVNFRKIGFITKITANKEVEWAKELTPNTLQEDLDIYEAKEFSDGSIYALGLVANTVTNNKKISLLKFSWNGNFLWQKVYDTVTNTDTSVFNLLPNVITEGINSEIIIGFSSYGFVYGSKRYVSIIKTNSVGEIIWQTHLGNTKRAPAPPPRDIVYPFETKLSNVQFVNGYLYCTANLPKQDGNLKGKSVIFKLDYSTGIFKKGVFSAYDYTSSATLVLSEFYHNSSFINGKYFSHCLETEKLTAMNEMFSFVYDTSLNIVRQQKFTTSGITYSPLSGTRKNIIVTSTDTTLINMPSDYHIYFFAVDKFGKIIQQRKLLNLNLSFSYYNKNLINATSDALAVILSANPFDKPSGFELVQYQDFDWGIDGCIGVNEPHLNIDSVPIDTGNFDFLYNHRTENYFGTNYFPNLKNLSFPKELVCVNVSICDSVKIAGVDTVCELNKPILFTAKRNPTCKKRIKWNLQNPSIGLIQNINDTTIAITFNTEWSGYL